MANNEQAGSRLPVYELIQRSRTEPQPFRAPSESDDDLEKSTSGLPPKPLPRRKPYSPFIVVTFISVFTIIALAILISKIEYMLPETGWVGSELTGASCDLMHTQNSSRLQSAFQINLRGTAQLSFGEAKFIDLVFDLFVGQGGRLLLAAVSYIVFMDALLRAMEITPVSYKLYASLVFSSNSLSATWRSIRAVSTTKGWRAKLYLIWCALAMVYVLAFPILIESATGYVQPSSTGFNVANGTIIMADSDNLTSCLDVFQGHMIGLPDGWKAIGPPAHVSDSISYLYNGNHLDNLPGINKSSVYYQILSQTENEPIYTATNSTRDPFSTYSRYNSSSYVHDDFTTNVHDDFTTNVTINGRMWFLNNTHPYSLYNPAYCFGDSLLYPSELQASSYCFAKSSFVWGFSSIVLYVVLGLQIIWTVGMYCVWLDANIASELVKYGRTIRGPFRAVADLAEAMNETLGPNYCAYTEEEIAKELDRSGNQLRYNTSLADDDELLHIGLTIKPEARVFLRRKQLYGSSDTARRRRVD